MYKIPIRIFTFEDKRFIFKDKKYEDFIHWDEFQAEFMKLCEDHYVNNRAKAFCFILYTRRNAGLMKVLNDYSYWHALDTISNRYLSIFSFDCYDELKKKKDDNIAGTERIDFDEGFEKANEMIITNYKDYNEFCRFPLLIFFQIDRNKFADGMIIQLKDQDAQHTYTELVEYISTAANTISLVKIENFENRKEIFDELKRRLNDRRNFKKIKLVFKGLKKLLPFFKSGF